MRRWIKFDNERCVWCRSCELICSLHHEGECNPSLARIRISLDLFEAEVEGHICRQCEEPKCLEACPVGAIRMDENTGAYIIIEDKCVSCGLCAEACPYNADGDVIFYNPAKKAYVKCDLCSGSPQCVEICPSNALEIVAAR